VIGTAAGDGSARARIDPRVRKEKGKKKIRLRGDKDGARVRRARIADGRRVASPATTRGHGMGARTVHWRAQ